jgi:hypothetical protein
MRSPKGVVGVDEERRPLNYAPPSQGARRPPWWDAWEWIAFAVIIAFITWCVVSGIAW